MTSTGPGDYFNITKFTCSFEDPSKSTFLWMTYFILLLLLGFPLVFIGLVTSLLSCGMFLLDRFTPKSTKLFLMTLSITDFLYLLGITIYVELKVIYRLYPHTKMILKKVEDQQPWYDINTVITNWLELFRNWGVVLIGTERYLVTCHPFRSAVWCTYSKALSSLVLCAIFTLILRIPLIIRRATNNHTEPQIQRLSKLAYEIHNYIDSIFLTLLPLIVLAFFSIHIIRALQQSDKMLGKSVAVNENTRHTRRAITNRRRLHVTRMLTGVLVVFFICGLPALSYVIIPYTSWDWKECIQKVNSILCYFMNILFSTSNFFIYVIYMPKYRVILHHMLYAFFCCAWRKMRNSNMREWNGLITVEGNSFSASNCGHQLLLAPQRNSQTVTSEESKRLSTLMSKRHSTRISM